MKSFKAGPNDAGRRLDKFILKVAPALPAALMQKYLRLKRIKVNGARAQADLRLTQGDVIEMYINDEFFPGGEIKKLPEASPDVNVVYEDDNVLIVNKPAGISVHEDEQAGNDNLIRRAQAYLHATGSYDPEKENTFAPALCHRLDRNTGGLVLIAKTAPALRAADEMFRSRSIKKTYVCLVHGTPKPRDGVLRHFLRRDKKQKMVTVFDHPVPDGLTAETGYRTLISKDDISLLECHPYTGRTHQIRAQLAYAGHPLCGDTKYGTIKQNKGLPFRYQTLWAVSLFFDCSADGPLAALAGKTITCPDPEFVKWFKKK